MGNNKEMRLVAANNASQYKAVYEYFAQDRFDGFFRKENHAIEYAGKNESSLHFVGDGLKCLLNVFDIKLPARCCPSKNYSLFKAKYLEAAYGEGNEAREITQLNSSALLALMFFYSINDTKPLFLSVSVKGDEHKLKLTSTLFEKENPVYAANHPSSIDVALYGTDTVSDENVVVFLESKFGEYLSSGNCAAGTSYGEFYSSIEKERKKLGLLKGIAFKYDNLPQVVGPDHYCHGIKQMISHYIGATNSFEANKENRIVYLGTILFDFGGIMDAAVKLDRYKQDYSDLSKILNNLDGSKKVNVIDSIITYQGLFGDLETFHLDDDVKEMYL